MKTEQIPKSLQLSGTYLLCNNNCIYKFKIMWRSKSAPTEIHTQEIMKVTENIIQSRNLPPRITTDQLEIVTKISYWSSNSKALCLRQFKFEKKGRLLTYKHAYVLLVYTTEDKKQCNESPDGSPFAYTEDGNTNESLLSNVDWNAVDAAVNCSEFAPNPGRVSELCAQESDSDCIPAFPFIYANGGQENEVSSCNKKTERVASAVSDSEFVVPDPMEVESNIGVAGVFDQEETFLCNNEGESDLCLEKYDSKAQNAVKGTEAEQLLICEVERLIENVCDDACLVSRDQNQSVSTTQDNGMYTATGKIAILEAEIPVHDGKLGHHVGGVQDTKHEHETAEYQKSVGFHPPFKNVITSETHSSAMNDHTVSHPQVGFECWSHKDNKQGPNIIKSEQPIATTSTVKDSLSSFGKYVSKMPDATIKRNELGKSKAHEQPLTLEVPPKYRSDVSMEKRFKHSTKNLSTLKSTIKGKKTYCESNDHKKINAKIGSKRKRSNGDTLTETDEIRNRKQGGTKLSRVVLCPEFFTAYKRIETRTQDTESDASNVQGHLSYWSFKENKSFQSSALSKSNYIENIISRAVGEDRTTGNICNFDNVSENWVPYPPVLERFLAVPQVIKSGKVIEICKYLIRNIQNRRANLCYIQQNGKIPCTLSPIQCYQTSDVLSSDFTPAFNTESTFFASKQNEIMGKQIAKESWQNIDEARNKAISDLYIAAAQASHKLQEIGASIHIKQEPGKHDSAKENSHTQKISNTTEKNTVKNLKQPQEEHSKLLDQDVKDKLTAGDIDHFSEVENTKSLEEQVNITNTQYKLELPDNQCPVNKCNEAAVPLSEDNCCDVFQKMDDARENLVSILKSPSGSVHKPTGSVVNDDLYKPNILHSARSKPDNASNTENQNIAGEKSEKQSNSDECSVPVKARGILHNIAMGINKNISVHTVDETQIMLLMYIYQNLLPLKEAKNIVSILTVLKILVQIEILEALVKRDSHPSNLSHSRLDSSHIAASRITTSSNRCSSNSDSAMPSQSDKTSCSGVRRSYRKSVTNKFFVPELTVVPYKCKETETIGSRRIELGKLLPGIKPKISVTGQISVNDLVKPHSRTRERRSKVAQTSKSSSLSDAELITLFLQRISPFSVRNDKLLNSTTSSISNPSVTGLHMKIDCPNFAKLPTSRISRRSAVQATISIDSFAKSASVSQNNSFSSETLIGTAANVHHCTCSPSIKLQELSKSAQSKESSPRGHLNENGTFTCCEQHYFHFQSENESVESFYSTIEKYHLALSKYQNNVKLQRREVLLRTILLSQQKIAISFYANLPIQKHKCCHCGLDTTAELCLKCGKLFELDESGNYVATEEQTASVHEGPKTEMSESAAKLFYLINDLCLHRPVVLLEQMKEEVLEPVKQNKIRQYRKKKRCQMCCNV